MGGSSRRIGRPNKTRDVDIVLRRADLPQAIAALESVGFIFRKAAGGSMFLDSPDAKAEPPSVLIHLLFEHKSYPDPLTPFQLLKYMVRIQERRLHEELPLCCVIPLVVYHGEQSWDVARSLEELIEVPEPLRTYIPDFRFPGSTWPRSWLSDWAGRHFRRRPCCC